MSKSAHTHTAPAKWLKHLLVQMVDRALFDTADLKKHPETALHRLRLRMKKADALLRLSCGAISKSDRKHLHHEIKQIKNAGGDQRDMEVVAKLATKLSDDPQHTAAHPKSTHGQRPDERQLKQWLKQLRTDLTDETFHGLSWKDVQDNFTSGYRKGRRQMSKADESQKPEAFHRWRKRVKALYYQSQALHATLVHPHLNRIRKLGKLLGREQDLMLLEETVHGKKGHQIWDNIITHQRKKLRPKIMKQGHRLFEESPRQFARWDGVPV